MATDKKISDLPLNGSINGSEEIAEERGGSNYKNTLEDVKTFVKDGLNTSEVTETTDKRYVTDAEKTVIGNTSGTNTGDQDLSGLQPILSEGAFVDGDKTKLDLNTSKVGITPTQASDIATNNAKVSDINHVTIELPNVENTSDVNKPTSTATQIQIDSLTQGQTGGLISFTTLAILQAYTDLGNNDSYKVTNDSTATNNGYYHWSGSAYIQDASLANGEVEKDNTEAVTGGKVYNINDIVTNENLANSYFILEDTFVNSPNGELVGVSGRRTVGIPISDVSVYSFGNFEISVASNYSFYNETVLVGFGGSVESVNFPEENISVPTGANIMYITFAREANIPSDSEFMMVNEGSTLLPYVESRIYTKSSVGFPFLAEALSDNNVVPYAVSYENGVNRRFMSNDIDQSIGRDTIEEGQNIINQLVDSSVSDTNLWESGFLHKGTLEPAASASYVYSKDFIPVISGDFNAKMYFSGNACVFCYNESGEVTQTVDNTVGYDFPVTFNTDIVAFRFSQLVTQTTSDIQMTAINELNKINNTVVPSLDYSKVIADNSLSNFGLNTITDRENVSDKLSTGLLTDPLIWEAGIRMNASGEPQADATWWSSILDEFKGGTYDINAYITGTANIVFYDVNKEVLQLISNPGASPLVSQEVINDDVFYYRMSFRGTQEEASEIYSKSVGEKHKNDSVQTENIVKENNTKLPVNGQAVSELMKTSIKQQHHAKSGFPLVSFISDDGHIKNDDWYLPVLDAKNIKSTFAIITRRFDNSDYYDSARVKELYDLGHDIAGHTRTHPYLTTLTLEQQLDEIRGSKQDLNEIGISNCPVFVCPYGDHSIDTDKIIRQFYSSNFHTDASKPYLLPLDSYKIWRKSFDAVNDSYDRIDLLKSYVDDAVANNKWIIFAVHPQFPEYYPDNGNTEFQARRDELSELIDYIRSLEISIVTAKDGLALCGNSVDIGNERLDTEYYSLAFDGTEGGNLF